MRIALNESEVELFEGFKSEKVAINTPLRTKHGSRIHQVSSLYPIFGEKKKQLSLFFSQQSLRTTHLVAFVKINLLELGYKKENRHNLHK